MISLWPKRRRTMKEHKVDLGKFYKTENGNVYLKVKSDKSIYVCNENINCSDPVDYINSGESNSSDVSIISNYALTDILKGKKAKYRG